MPIIVGPFIHQPEVFAPLRQESEAEGLRMLQRLEQNWLSGHNRFDQPGERVLAAMLGNQLVGVCGRNRDPFDPVARAGRVRHLYVSRAFRRQGVGAKLLHAIIADAGQYFDYLNTHAPQSAWHFYQQLGFVATHAHQSVSHRLGLR